MNKYYPHLYSPIKIGPLVLRNRMVASPTSQADLLPDGTLDKHNIGYYARKAKGGAAVVTVGDNIVCSVTGQNHPRQQYADKEYAISSMKRCAEEIHRYGAYACAELSHGGICCDPAFIGGKRPIGPSEVPVNIGFQTEGMVETYSQAMTLEQMEDIAEKFGQAAARVQLAGFDMCLVHGAHGWLLNQFLSPDVNLRTDEFGGSVENRCRFPIMVLKSIRKHTGKNFPISFRINGDDLTPTGLHLDETVEICKILEPYVDCFHVSAGVHYVRATGIITHASMFLPRGMFVDYAAAVKKAVKVPVVTVNGHSYLEDMEEIIASGKADIIAMARQLVCDPDTPKKGRTGNEDVIRHCLRCGWCQSTRFIYSTARCAINPEIGREYQMELLPPAKHKRKVLVIGGGPGGMQAAITAADRGHDVVLYEKKKELGGILTYAKEVSFKEDLYRLVGTMKAEMARYDKLKVILDTELTPEMAEAEGADTIICAIGSEPIVPPIPGIDKPIVVPSAKMHDAAALGENIVIIGGGLVGCEAAVHLGRVAPDSKITIVEMADRIAGDCHFRHRWAVETELEKLGIAPTLNTRCVAVTDSGVLVEGAEGQYEIPASGVIIAVGQRPLQDKAMAFADCAPQFFSIGDCMKVAMVTEAIRGGFDAAISID